MSDTAAAPAAPLALLPPEFYDDKSWVAILVVVLCLAVATTMVGLRIWTRKVIINKMGMDDWAAIVTLVMQSIPRWGRRGEEGSFAALVSPANCTNGRL